MIGTPHMTSDVTLNIKIGYEIQSLKMTIDEWSAVQSGKPIVKEAVGYYEGEEFTYTWCFNDARFANSSLVVFYGDAEGFIGSVQDCWLS